MLENYQVVIADDNAFVRKGLVSILGNYAEFQIVGEAGDGFALLKLLSQGISPDILVLDLSMPLLSGIEVIHRIRQMHFSFKILALTMHKEPHLLCQAFLAGADGYMLKNGTEEELLSALYALAQDKVYLSPQIAEELPDRCRTKAAAEQGFSSCSIKHCGNSLIESPERI